MFLSVEQIQKSLSLFNKNPQVKLGFYLNFEISYFYASEKVWIIDIGALGLLGLLKDTSNTIHFSLNLSAPELYI